jgi:dipeptidyl aminopeptidase/acylaminoacyl peptidase
MPQADNLKKLSAIPIVESVERVHLTPEIKRGLSAGRVRRSVAASRRLFAYRIKYRSQGHSVMGFIVEPRKGAGKLPCIVWNRGGSGDFGAIKRGLLFSNAIGALAQAGYIVFASQYSGNAGSEGRDELGGGDVEDVLNLYRIIRAYKRADASRIGMFGHSRGGMMTFLALKKARWIKAVAVNAPMTDALKNANDRGRAFWRHYAQFFRTTSAALRARSVVKWVGKLPKRVPILILHGTGDWRVRAEDSVSLAARLYTAKIPFRLVIYEGADHSMTEFRQEARAQVIAWFDRFVKRREKLPDLKPHGE